MDIDTGLVSKSREYEFMFCAAAFISGDVALAECRWLEPNAFITEKFRKFWEKTLEYSDSQRAAIELEIELELFSRASDIPLPIPFNDYARKVAEYSYLRNSMESVRSIVNAVQERNVEAVSAILSGIQEHRISDGTDMFSSEVVEYEFRKIAFAVSSYCVKTYIPEIDNCLGGFFPGDLIIVAGRPGMGKTAFITQIGRNVSISGKKVLLFSLEMTKEQLWARMACPMAGLEWRDVRSGNVTQQQMQNLEIESVCLGDKLKGNFLMHDEVYTVGEIYSLCVRNKPDLVIIDQLPEIHWTEPGVKEIEWYGQACKYLRTYVAKFLKCPVILVHQLNRGVEDRDDKKPKLSDLRQSGEIEQRADVVLVLYRNDYYVGRAPGQNNVPMDVIVRKNRQGEMSANLILDYDLKKQWFT